MARAGKKLERELEDLAPVEAHPARRDAGERLARALASTHAHVVARAAAVIAEHRLDGHADALLGTYERMLRDAGKADPGCHAKTAVLEALDHTEHADGAPFLEASRYQQWERRWGGVDETAGSVRARGALALVRLRYEDALLVLGRLLADEQTQVRQVAATALAEHGDRDGAALLLLRIGVGEPDPAALTEQVKALFRLAPDHGGPAVRPLLADRSLRELVAHALADSGTDEAIDLLLAEMGSCVLASDREALIRALGISRRPAAREALLGLVERGNAGDAPAAVRALAVHSYDPALRDQVFQAASRNEAVELAAVFAEAWPDSR